MWKRIRRQKQGKDENKCSFPESGNHQDCWPHHVLQHYGALTLKLNMLISLQVLYLYNNKIRTMEALESAPNIELLYLQVWSECLLVNQLSQNNRISRLSGLEKLTKLKKLYLTKNRIQVFEGLTTNKHLEEVDFTIFISNNSIFTKGAHWQTKFETGGAFCVGPPVLSSPFLLPPAP